ncbi:MAG TPA: protein-methionine-sulfoxide reductase catalytic subunit MsrP [bacterium]|mgnify:FL=1|nr:protein-methionine-sulfoxide reductase catalytic subunit MsrP [bacterium]HOL93544.1 protein-methionine-sulfoxide reductase catalytic subunit MsrP [bacterium]
MEILKRVNAPESEVTDPKFYWKRRTFLAAGAVTAVSGAIWSWAQSKETSLPVPEGRFNNLPKSPYGATETPTDKKLVTTYVNFYEFGTDKHSPVERSKSMNTSPWTVEVSGECARPAQIHLEDFLNPTRLEERIYRFRCVETWSMVVPWIGFPLADLIKRAEPTSNAKYVKFTTLYDPKQMPGQRMANLNWPYVEGLRMDEALHPLTLLAVGMYGDILPNQNGAPLRLVVPWKYGFKSIKSIVKIEFMRVEPPTAWSTAIPHEYGFYANVNPEVPHPRWSQAKEKRLGEMVRRDTLPFNGYADQVAPLYAGMDLKKYY